MRARPRAGEGEILLVSKPVVPPWNDSSKNLVHDLARSMERYAPHVMVPRGADVELPRGRAEEVYAPRSGGYAPALRDNARVLLRLGTGRRLDLWHFFFAPNPRTSAIGRIASRARRVPTVQTVCSMPRDVARSRALLFADRTVVLSKKSEARFLDAGVDASRLVRIGPAIEPLAPTSEDERARARASFGIPEGTVSVVFPGDLEFGGGAALVVEAFATLGRDDAFLVVACRDKTEAAKEARRALAERASALGIAPRVLFLGETPRIHALLDAADVVALPSGDLFAKMDHPLVLLEAMSLEKPVVVAVGSAAEELAESGGAAAVEPRVDALAAELSRLLDDAGERRRRGRLARAYVVERCDRREMARAYEALYDGLVG